MTRNVYILLSCMVLGVLGGCSGISGPSSEMVAEAVRASLSAGAGFTLERFEAIPVPDSAGTLLRINYKGRVTAKEARYNGLLELGGLFEKHSVPFPNEARVKEFVDEDDDQNIQQEIENQEAQANRIEWQNIPSFVTKTVEIGAAAEVMGRCTAEKRLDEWLVQCGGFDQITGQEVFRGDVWAKLQKRDEVKTLDIASAEAEAYFAEYAARVQQRKQTLIAQLKQRQDVRKRLRVQYMPHVSRNQVYEGTMTYVDRWRHNGRVRGEGTVPVRISFSVDGRRVKARLTNTGVKEEYVDLESFWPLNAAEHTVDQAEFPLVMRTTEGRYQYFAPGRHDAPKLFSSTDAASGGLGFKFNAKTLTGSMRSEEFDYRITAARVGE